MKHEEKIKMFNDVFAPKSGEKVLFMVDIPHDDVKDNEMWKDRREMAWEWYHIFKEMGNKSDFDVDILEFEATGMHNAFIPKDIMDVARKSNLLIAMTEYSASSSLIKICDAKDAITRGASLPQVERRMEETAFRADYSKVKKYAIAIQKMLNDAVGAEVSFSTGNHLYMDLRNRIAKSDTAECIKTGQGINFPSGEGYIAPYEAASDEISEFGESKTEGIWPVSYDGELVKYIIKNNKIVEIMGDGEKSEEMRKYFAENITRMNVAELGIGCNPKAVITGNVLEDEKVGLHIAYGMSSHIGGKVDSDMHLDICYSKGCPVEGTALTLINEDGTKTELIKNAMIRYDLLEK